MWSPTVAVVVAFFLCWAPFHAQRLMFGIITSKDQWTDTLRSINTQLYCFTGKQPHCPYNPSRHT